MPLYKLHCISAHYPEYQHIKDLVTRSAKLMLENGSPVRSIEHHGTRVLPQKMRRHKTTHHIGDYWTMHFDAPPHLAQTLSSRLRDDPRVIRWTTLKLGSKLEDVVSSSRPRSTRRSEDSYNESLNKGMSAIVRDMMMGERGEEVAMSGNGKGTKNARRSVEEGDLLGLGGNPALGLGTRREEVASLGDAGR